MSDVDQKRNELIRAADDADEFWGQAMAEQTTARIRAEDAIVEAKAAEARTRVARTAMRQSRMALVQHIEEQAGYWKARAAAESRP